MHPTGALRWSSATNDGDSKRDSSRDQLWIQGALQLVRHSPHRTWEKNFGTHEKGRKIHSDFEAWGCKTWNDWIQMVFSRCFLVFRCLFNFWSIFSQKQHPAKVLCSFQAKPIDNWTLHPLKGQLIRTVPPMNPQSRHRSRKTGSPRAVLSPNWVVPADPRLKVSFPPAKVDESVLAKGFSPCISHSQQKMRIRESSHNIDELVPSSGSPSGPCPSFWSKLQSNPPSKHRCCAAPNMPRV